MSKLQNDIEETPKLQPSDKNSKNFMKIINVVNEERKFKAKYRKSKYPGAAPINRKALERQYRGEGIARSGVKTEFFKKKLKNKEKQIKFAEIQAARTEILLKENDGFLEAEEGEKTYEYTQDEIVANVDITSATKRFDLNLDFGPYRLRYTRNGRHLLLGGKKGHVSAFDWIQKRLNTEINVMEEVADIAWMHIETMLAVAQKNWVHFYDNQGVEIHCVKKMSRVNRLEFLPYHFLLAAGNDSGYLSWLDVSIGEFVANYQTKIGRITIMTQNPANGVICTGNSKGVVAMWSPTMQEPLTKILCHPASITSIAVNPQGTYLATSGADRTVKLWDTRQLDNPLTVFKQISASTIDISQKGVLALGCFNSCLIYKNPLKEETNEMPYLSENCKGLVTNVRFCPYEDILGIGTNNGFKSILVPGSGEPNYDGVEANPFQTKSQRREYEVHALLEKIPSEFIALDPQKIIEVDVPTLRDKMEARKKIIYLKPEKIDYQPRKKAKGRGGVANYTKNKQNLQDQTNRVCFFLFLNFIF